MKSQIKMTNQKSKLANLKSIVKRYLNFDFCNLNFAFQNKGITILLVVIILSAILSISIGVFNVVYGQLRISGDVEDSFRAMYAADLGMERILYKDRVIADVCTFPSNCAGGTCDPCYTEDNSEGSAIREKVPVPMGACYKINVYKVSDQGATTTQIISIGQYRCGATPSRVVKRGFEVMY